MAEIVELDDTNFQSALEAEELPVLVDFWATWCGPCKKLGEELAELAVEQDGRFTIVKVNIEESPQTAIGNSVLSLPTMILFKGGDSITTITGAMPKHEIMEQIEEHL